MKIRLSPYISIALFLNLSLTACVNQTVTSTPISTSIQKNTLIRDDIPVKELTKIEAFTGNKGEIQRIPSILKLKGNQILYFWSGGVKGYDGDLEGAKLYKRILQYNSKGQIIDSGKKELFYSSPDSKGVAKQPMLGRTKDGR
ncbi:exo-alpha-sialidase, partial [Acinetobacter baumannii]|nr:exo-alpha-sialidase [Acinetobacter baumannii]